MLVAFGISPFDTLDLPENWAAILLNYIQSHSNVVAIGEIGLDFTNPRYPDKQIQCPVFERQLSIANKTHRCAIMHSRGAEKEVIEIAQKNHLQKGILHCFTGDRDHVRKALDANLSISISGIITFKNTHLRDLLEFIPLDRLFIESDTPYLAPVPFRGKPNQPAFVSTIGKFVADLIKIDPEKLQFQLMQNYDKLFKVNP